MVGESRRARERVLTDRAGAQPSEAAVVFGEIQLFEDSFLAFPHFSQSAGSRLTVVHLIETQLQHAFSMRRGQDVVKWHSA